MVEQGEEEELVDDETHGTTSRWTIHGEEKREMRTKEQGMSDGWIERGKS